METGITSSVRMPEASCYLYLLPPPNHFPPNKYLNASTVAALASTLPSVYQLLPRTPFIAAAETGRLLSLEESYQEGPGHLRSSRWVPLADEFHQSISQNANVPQFLIVGSGLPTVDQLEFFDTIGLWCVHTGNGDSTVPLASATAIGGQAYYLMQAEHGQLANDATTHQLLMNILSDNLNAPLPSGVSRTPYAVAPSWNWCTYSPVLLTITDAQLHAAGVTPDGATQNDIPGSTFLNFTHNQSGALLAEGNYRLQATGTGTGLFSLSIKSPESGAQYTFDDIPVMPGTIATTELMPEQNHLTLELDINGDGVTDITIQDNAPMPPQTSLELLCTIVGRSSIKKGIRDSILAKLDAATHDLATGRGNAARNVLAAALNEVRAQTDKGIPAEMSSGYVQIITQIISMIR